MLSARDSLTINFTPSEAVKRAEEFRSTTADQARHQFDLGQDTRDDLNLPSVVQRVSYRPFDDRFVIYTGRSRGFVGQPARPLARATFGAQNLILVVSNRIELGTFRHVFVADGLPDGHTVSSKETNHVYPLYVYLLGENALRENIAPEFRRWIEERFTLPLTPEELISYVYAVLHAGSYRALYSDFLLIDAPRLPFPESADDFEVLSGLGWALVQAHLLRELPRRRLAAYHGKGGHTVEALHYSPEQQAVAINRTQFFKPVPQAVRDSTSAALIPAAQKPDSWGIPKLPWI